MVDYIYVFFFRIFKSQEECFICLLIRITKKINGSTNGGVLLSMNVPVNILRICYTVLQETQYYFQKS